MHPSGTLPSGAPDADDQLDNGINDVIVADQFQLGLQYHLFRQESVALFQN